MAPRRNLPHHDRGLERVETLPGGAATCRTPGVRRIGRKPPRDDPRTAGSRTVKDVRSSRAIEFESDTREVLLIGLWLGLQTFFHPQMFMIRTMFMTRVPRPISA